MFRLLRNNRSLVAALSRRLLLTKRMASSLLIENEKYSFLKDLGLERENSGVFYGQWQTGGDRKVGVDVAV